MSLATPEKIRRLQRKLYVKAKEEPAYRFYALYDKVYREDILSHAYRLCRSRGGAAGVDGVTFSGIESEGVGRWLAGLQEELHSRAYRPDPVRRVRIAKSDGGVRPLGIPTIRDRVVQTAAKLVLEPIFEADFRPPMYGYRPRRSARQAVEEVHRSLCEGYTDVVDADLSSYFDTIPHDALMKSVARRVVDKGMLKLIRSWWKAPVEEIDEKGTRRRAGGRRSWRGIPQGSVIGPLLANLYLNRFLRHWESQRKGEVFRARVVAYADDFVILSRGHAAEALEWTREVMERLGLALNETKTCTRNAWREPFDFLGYAFGPERYWRTGRPYLSAQPSRRSQRALQQRIRGILHPGNHRPWPEVAGELGTVLRGWSSYFAYGSSRRAFRRSAQYVLERTRHFLRRRHKVPSRGTRRFPAEWIAHEVGLHWLESPHRGRLPWALA
ncbi:MAG: group II intron reverse transcriptase/maturase [Thermoanaerobaculia bacterium]